MALQILSLQKIMFSHVTVGVPLRSITALRYFSRYSVLKSRLNAGIVLKKMVVSGPIKLASVTQRRILYQINENSYSTVSSGHEEDVTASDTESESETAQEDDSLGLIFETKTNLSYDDWEAVTDQFAQYRRYAKITRFDGIIMRQCLSKSNYALANSYLEYLQTQKYEPNLVALACYLQLCGVKIEECGEEKVLDVYQQLTSKVKAFDVTLSEHAILALTKTSKWKQAFKHLPVIRKLCIVNAKVYSAFIVAAFKNGEYGIGWELLETMCKEEKEPKDTIFLEWINQCELAEDKEAMLSILLHKIAVNEIYPKVPVAKEIMKIFEESIGWSGTYVQIFNKGICPACNHQLETAEVDEEAFAILKEEFVSRVLHGSDIFKTTSPEEWSRFSSFVQEEGPFDFVVDGLNVAYMAGRKNPHQRMRRLSEAVAKIKVSNQKKRIMVIGRKHMEMWSSRDMSEVKRRAKVFTLDNISKDDGFFIYAALQSGIGTQFVSSDLLRDHIHRLGDVSLRETFRRWQRKHQIFVEPTPAGLHLVPPPDFRTAVQKQGADAWHIPYNNGSLRKSYQVPHTWLCLQSQPHQHEELKSVKHVSRVPFECSDEKKKSIHYMDNPKDFGIGPGIGNFANSKYSKAQLGNFANSKYSKAQLGNFANSKYSKAQLGNFANSEYSKAQLGNFANSRNKMKEDMREITSSDKIRYRRASLPTSDTRGLPSKREPNTRKIVLKDLFRKT